MSNAPTRPEVADQESSGVAPAPARLARGTRARPRLLGELAIVLILVFCYDWVQGLATASRGAAVMHGLEILRWENGFHLDVELSYNQWLSSHSTLADIASWYYQLAHLTVTLLVLLACYVWRPSHYRAARNALVLINSIALVIFWVFPTAPPRLLPGLGFVDTTQRMGVASSAPDPYAAMPSLHTAWAVWTLVVMLMMVRRRWLKVLWVAYPVTTILVIVGTGNHYVLDVILGTALTVIAALFTTLLPALLRSERARAYVGDNANP
ncbi:MAG: phosphatase PAP2 family protein [Nocardioidaceae bacterium]